MRTRWPVCCAVRRPASRASGSGSTPTAAARHAAGRRCGRRWRTWSPPRGGCGPSSLTPLSRPPAERPTEVGVEGLAAVATSTTVIDHPGRLSFAGLDGIAATSRGLLLDAQKGFAFVVDCSQAKEFTLAHWLVNGADGGRLFVRCFGGDGIVRENFAGDVLASLTTMLWNAPSKSWTGGATMADAR